MDMAIVSDCLAPDENLVPEKRFRLPAAGQACSPRSYPGCEAIVLANPQRANRAYPI